MADANSGRVRLAVVGCGAVAAIHHLPAIAASRQVELAMLVDRDRERAAALARRWGRPAVVTDFRDAAGRVDAALVTLPNHLHAPVAIDLLGAGVPVLVEKPMALTAAECDAMIAAAGAARRPLAVGLDFRFFDSTALVGSLLAAGTIGELRGFEVRQGVVPRWPFASDYVLRRETAGGGVLADYGVHVLDLLLVWLGDLAVEAYRDDAAGGLEADCEVELRTAAGVRGRAELSRTRNLRNTCRFTGTRGTLEVGVWEPDPEIRLVVAGEERALAGRARGGRSSAGLSWSEVFRRQLDDFAAAVRGRGEPRVGGREGRRSVALIEACYRVRQPLVYPWESMADASRPSAAGRAAGG